MSPRWLLNKLTRGDVSQAELAVIEGWNFRQLRAALDRHPDLRHDTAGLSDAQILEKLGVDAPVTPKACSFRYLSLRPPLQRSRCCAGPRKITRRCFDREWQRRADGLPYKTPHEALIMASIVEKETGQAADRPMVASVFINRCAPACCSRPTRR